MCFDFFDYDFIFTYIDPPEFVTALGFSDKQVPTFSELQVQSSDVKTIVGVDKSVKARTFLLVGVEVAVAFEPITADTAAQLVQGRETESFCTNDDDGGQPWK